MKKAFRAVLAATAVALSGCAAVQHKPIAADPTFWQNRAPVIGVAAEGMPEADAQMLGNQGLLDMAINKGNAAKMIEQLKKLKLDRAAAIPNNMAAALGQKGFKLERLAATDVSTLPEFKADATPELYALKDYRGLAGKGVDRLLLISVENVGTTRTYYGFLPTGAPRALFTVKGQLVDLKTNKLIWYDRQEATADIPEPWDQEPDFPNVSAAVLKNIDDGAKRLERSLFAGQTSVAAAK